MDTLAVVMIAKRRNVCYYADEELLRKEVAGDGDVMLLLRKRKFKEAGGKEGVLSTR